MSKFILVDWEINGYDDSDFMCTYYDDKADKLEVYMYGTTRFGGCICNITSPSGYHVCRGEDEAPEPLLMPTKEIVEKARVKLEDYIFNQLSLFEKNLVEQPRVENLQPGLVLKLKANVRSQAKQTIQCPSCKGSGHWVNPRNAEDKRECFKCGSKGYIPGPAPKDESGKVIWNKFQVGQIGTVEEWRSFGTFYRNGHNKPDIHNTSVYMRTPEGVRFSATLEKLRLARDEESPEKIRARAKELSLNYHFGSLHHKCAWLTHNFAERIAKEDNASEQNTG